VGTVVLSVFEISSGLGEGINGHKNTNHLSLSKRGAKVIEIEISRSKVRDLKVWGRG
jgi:hypothetical protein